MGDGGIGEGKLDSLQNVCEMLSSVPSRYRNGVSPLSAPSSVLFAAILGYLFTGFRIRRQIYQVP